MRHLDATDLALRPELRPMVLAPGAMGQERRLLVSPQHGILLANGPQEALVQAIHLARLPGSKVRVANGVRSVTYVHLMFERHQVIWGNDLRSESFSPGPWALSALDPAALREMARPFPVALRLGAAAGYGATARLFRSFAGMTADLSQTRMSAVTGQSPARKGAKRWLTPNTAPKTAQPPTARQN